MNKIQLFIIVFFFSIISTFSQEKKYTKYVVQEGETIQSISQKLSITPYTLLQLNPDLKNGLEGIKVLIIPNKNFKINSQDEHKDYVEDGFLFHKVLPKENFYRIKQTYGVAKRLLRKHNPILRREDLKVGQIIKIPVDSNFKLTNTVENSAATNTKPYLVKPKETKYSISRRYGITIEKLEELNPKIKVEGLQKDAIILVPDTAEIPDESDDFVTHQVEKKETIFSLGQKFNISEEDLIAANPEIKDGLKEGMLIKIPKIDSAEEKLFVPSIVENKEINAILLLPFMSDKASIDFQKNRTSDIVSDFYLGAQMALDSLKKLGLSVNVKVFDTRNNKQRIQTIFSALDVTNIDVVIGPMFYDNIEYVSSLLRGKNIPIISPVSKKDHSRIYNLDLIQEVPSKEGLSEKVTSYIKDNYKSQNLVVITDDKEETIPFLNAIVTNLQEIDSINTIEVIKPEKGYIKPEIFREKLIENQDNWVVLVTEDAVVTRDVINNIGVLPKEFKPTLFALEKGKNFDDQNDINNSLAHVNFHYPTYSYIDHENEVIKYFINSYKRINYVEPTEYAFKGFDMTYDSMLRFASYSDTNEALNAGSSERLCTKFQYQKNKSGSGFVNNGVFLIKYDGLNLVKVN